ncbi:MAG: AbrB/MazE/SpoVT family DNA-binding domain-containing protein [Candidatus Diapherotrites archaeon]|nr:AbrB/MazE/SpoVT family DNA-binding domain-containing protein [Candidatus Diapherotrites archaeon]MDZ4256302.1 AbrB/MazE/SpoVT family DNA-binding domain-containing protein [archaeon]
MSDVAIVTVSAKGQIQLPKRMRDSLKLSEGARLFMEEKNGTITLQKMEHKAMDADWSSYLLSHKSLAKTWDTKEEDEAWKHL